MIATATELMLQDHEGATPPPDVTEPAPRAHVERIASRKIKGFLGTIDGSGEYYDPVHKQNQSLSQHIIADYHGRFLIELIQNGHDAHDRERRDGEIAVLFSSDEGESGTLYVANRGKPFERRNVDALCEMGLSSKPPGEAVGNKGLGFRSVWHISDAPQVYSRSVEDGQGAVFDGYCFTFARGAELDPLLPDETTRALARSDLPAFYIPQWIEAVPTAVADFAARGFSTVIRLALRNDAALEVVRGEMLGLEKADAPMLLFLRRIGRLEARITGERLKDHAFDLELTRDEAPLVGDDGPTFVDLGDNGRFWVARAAIPQDDMQAAVEEGLESGALPQSWKGWKGAGEVAVAIPVGEERTDFNPRLYTFLPMGRGATSPFRGHLHGSFFSSSNRMSLDPTVRVNALVLDHAVKLSSATARWMTEHAAAGGVRSEISSVTSARVAVDLLMWKTPASLLEVETNDRDNPSAAVDLGAVMATEIARRWSVRSIGEAPIVPCLAVWTGDRLAIPEYGPVIWTAPAAARRLTVDGKSFTIEIIARYGVTAGVAPFWPGLGAWRTEQLAEFLRRHVGATHKDRLLAVERAAIAEALAIAHSNQRRPDWDRWKAFYRDLSEFMGGDATALAGRKILICQDGSLRPTRAPTVTGQISAEEQPRKQRRRARETSVFIPPRRGDNEESIGEEFYPPAPVREFFAFLNDVLPWYGELAAARQFLEKDLATPFESEALLTRIAQIVEKDTAKKVRTAGLRWAFAIWRRSVAIKRPVALSPNYRLFVPTLTGEFIRATDAIFSSSWPDRTLGYDLQQFLEIAPTDKDLDDVRARRLAHPASAAFGKNLIKEWTEFLEGLGVQRGLQPRTIEHPNYIPAGRVLNFAFLAEIDLPASFGPLLRADIGTRPGLSLSLPTSTDYDVGALWWLPGQSDIDRFTDDDLDLYAKLIVEWIGTSESRHFRMTVKHRHNHNADNRDWPTPLAAFLRTTAWIPCEEQGEEGPRRRRCTGRDVWLAGATDRYPPFLRRPSFKLARAFDRAPTAAMDVLRARAEIRTFNARDSLLAQIEFLTEQYAGGCVRRFHERELMNIYGRCWVRLADQHAANEATATSANPPPRLLARRKAQLGIVRVRGKEPEPVYVRDGVDPIATSLVEVIGDPLIDIRATDPSRLGNLMHKLYGGAIRRTSELAYAIHVDGSPFEQLPIGARLVDRCPWLRPMLAVALEALESVDLNRLPSDRSGIIQALDRIELQQVTSVRFFLEGSDVTPPTSRPAYQFARADEQPVVIIIAAGDLSWQQIEAALPAIGDAIRQPAAVPHLKLLARQLSMDFAPVNDRPAGQDDLVRLCRTLELGEQATEAARDALGERIERLLPWYRAIVWHFGGELAHERWLENELAASEDRATLIDLLRTILPDGSATPDEIVEAAKMSLSIPELRAKLDIEFGAFNASLVATGSLPDVNPDAQKAQLAFFIDDRSMAINDALRNMVAPTLFGFEPDPRYQAARKALESLQPDPDWLQRYDRIPEDLMFVRLADWLAERGAPPMGGNPQGLDELASVRVVNAAALRKLVKVGQPLVRAWGVQRSKYVPDLWKDAGQAEAALRQKLDEAGAFDCRGWSEADLLTWFGRLGVWPAEMPKSLDRTELDVAETEVEAQAVRAREDREKRDRDARSVQVNGQRRDPQTVDWLALSEELSTGLTKNLLNRPIGTFADLAPADQSRRRRWAPNTGGGGDGGGAYVGVPQEKKDMIGRLGELTVYHWLKARQPGQDIDACWKSSNATPFTGREGRDGLGYDFRISHNKQTWYIEVKASIDDPCHFELGETEVRKARDIAQSRSADRYVIAYVANVGNGAATTIDVLPNPLAADADGVLNIAGDSIRYTFGRR